MSAYVVSRECIAYLVEAIFNRNREGYAAAYGLNMEPDALGRVLWSENIKSVEARYPSCSPDEMPGTVGESHVYGTHRRPHGFCFDPVQVIKAVDCYQYQSCEHEGWDASEAKNITDRLRCAATHRLPGYSDAVWGCPADRGNE